MRESAGPSLPLLLAAGLLLVNQAPARAPAREGTAFVKLAEVTPAPGESYDVAPSCVPAWVVDASGIRRLPDRCGTTELSSAPIAVPPGVSLSPPPARSRPVPPAGRQAAAGVPAAGVPAAVTPARPVIDTRHVRARAGKECSPPTYIDRRGVRRLRPNCF